MMADWDDDSLDVILRDVLRSRPPAPPIRDLSRRAVQRAQARAAAARRTSHAACVAFPGWHLTIAACAAATVVFLGWFALGHLALWGPEPPLVGLAATGDAPAAGGGILEILSLEETATAAIAITLLSVGGVIVAGAFARDQGPWMECSSDTLP